MSAGILDGHFVPDFGGWRGGFTGKILADLGADVVTVTNLGQVDDHPPLLEKIDTPSPSSAAAVAFGVGKRSVAVALNTPEGKAVVARLVARSSFIVEALTNHGARTLGLDYPFVRELNARAILISITPFGRHVEHELFEHADGLAVAATSGFLYTTGTPDRAPALVGGEQAFMQASAYAAAAALIAHRQRRLTGEGSHVDVSAQEALLLCLGPAMPYWQVDRKVSMRVGNSMPGRGHPKSVYACADGHVTFGPLLGRPERVIDWMEELDEPGTAELRRRVTDLTQRDSAENLAFIEARFGEFLKSRTQQEIWDAALARRFMMFPINDLNDVVASPVHKDRAFFTDLEVGLGTSVRYPVRTLPGQSTTEAPGAPQVGRETAAVLDELGFSDAEIAAFRHDGVIAS